jgi:HSP20 family protein
MMQRAGDLVVTGQPMEHTFTKVIGTDGAPHISERIGGTGAEVRDVRPENEGGEPLVDVWENDSAVTVLVELPGINKEDIRMEVVRKKLRLVHDTEKKMFSKEIDLPCKVRASSAKVNYRGSVLEVLMEKPAPRKKKKVLPDSI